MNFEQFLKSKLNYIILFLLGALLSFSLPPYNNVSLCFIIFPALLYLLKTNELNGPKVFFIYGLSFSFGYFSSSLYWISYSLNFDPEVLVLKPFALIGLPFVLSLFYGLGFYIFRLILFHLGYFHSHTFCAPHPVQSFFLFIHSVSLVILGQAL